MRSLSQPPACCAIDENKLPIIYFSPFNWRGGLEYFPSHAILDLYCSSINSGPRHDDQAQHRDQRSNVGETHIDAPCQHRRDSMYEPPESN
jgi:hypothetical protein